MKTQGCFPVIKKGVPLRVLFIRTTLPNERGFIPPLGLIYLAAVIRERYDDAVIEIVDYAVDGPSKLKQMVNSFCPTIIGLSGMTHEFSLFYNLVNDIQKIIPEAIYLAGGPIATYNYEELFSKCRVDFAVQNEGEVTVVQLIKSLYSGENISKVHGIVYKINEKLQINPPQPFIQNLDSLPIPAWDLIDLEKYSNIPNWNGAQKEKIYAPLYTSRGCPYRCSYCHSMFGKHFRARSPDHILKELQFLYNHFGVRELHFIDDVFNLSTERTKEICRKLIDSDMRFAIAFPNGVRVDIMTEEVLRLLKQAGTYKINYAIETVTPRIQSEIRKNINLDNAKNVIEITSKMGILTFGFFMLGFPSETKNEIQNTIDFAVNSMLDTAKFLKVTPYKGTELGDYVLSTNHSMKEIALSNFTFYDTLSSANMEINKEELENFLKQAYRRFYMNPARIWRIIRKHPGRWRAIKNLYLIFKYTGKT